ncbi:hypothetical protein EZS27_001400 [termite gut metagenome]|uniref:BIG2 domain-containing protein n=1 Tax=termite gut metagenome TaxID=433724 RepID=A0A5J4SZ02_9ZZZZ
MKKNLLILVMLLPLVTFSGCSKNDEEKLKLDKSEISLYYEETEKITANKSDLQWSSENEFIAEVDNEGLVIGGHVGETYITARSEWGEARCKVEIKAKYNLFDDLIIEFGKSRAYIKSQEKRVLISDDEKELIYKLSSSSSDHVVYFFGTSGLEASTVIIKLPNPLTENITNYLLERFQFIDSNDEKTYFSFNKNSIYIGYSVYADGVSIKYTKYTGR